MFLFFDYIYYRVNKAYFKWDGRNGSTSIIAVSMLQTMIITDIFVVFIKMNFDENSVASYSKTIAYVAVALFCVFAFFNYFKYKDKYNNLKTRWKNETTMQRIFNGFLVVLSLIIPWVLLVMIAV